MVQLNCSFLMKLRIQEFPQAFKEICSIYEEEQIEELHVKESLSRLNAHEGDLQFVWEMRNPHRLTKVVLAQNTKRKDYLVGLRTRIKAITVSPIDTERVAANTLFLWINKHRQHIYSTSSIIQTRLVDNLKTELVSNVKIADALSELKLDTVFNSIVMLSTEIVENVKVRDDEQNQNLSKAEVIKRAAYSELVSFLKSLQTAVNLEDPEVGFYAGYELKIDARLDKYRTKLLQRTTRRKNAALNAENSEVVVDENNGAGEATPTNATNGTSAKDKLFSIQNMADSSGSNVLGDVSDISEMVKVAHKGAINGSDQANENHA